MLAATPLSVGQQFENLGDLGSLVEWMVRHAVPLLLPKEEDIFVLEDVEPAHKRAVPPQLFLIPLGRRVLKVLHDDALQREATLHDLIHRQESQGYPLPLGVF